MLVDCLSLDVGDGWFKPHDCIICRHDKSQINISQITYIINWHKGNNLPEYMWWNIQRDWLAGTVGFALVFFLLFGISPLFNKHMKPVYSWDTAWINQKIRGRPGFANHYEVTFHGSASLGSCLLQWCPICVGHQNKWKMKLKPIIEL